MRPLILLCFVFLLISSSRPVSAQSFTSYATFQTMPNSRLQGLQIKLSYLGTQRQRVVTQLIVATGSPVAVHQFVPYRRPGYAYGTDDDSLIVVQVPILTLRNILIGVGTIPGVVDGGVDPGGRLSYAMVDTINGSIGFESIVDAPNGRALFAALAQMLASEPSAAAILDDLACQLDLRDSVIVTNVTDLTSVTLSGVRYDHLSERFAGKVRVTNTGVTPLAGPVSVVFDGLLRIDVLGASGFTCRALPGGSPYLNVLAAGSLSPGAFVESAVYFDNPSFDPIEVTLRVLAGGGSR
jgi:hypothetical protein